MNECPRCMGKLHFKNEEGLWEECDCFRNKKIDLLFSDSDFPEVYKGFSLENVKLKNSDSLEAVKIAKAVVEDYRNKIPLSKNLWFWDESAVSGKCLVSVIGQSALKGGFSVLFTSVQDIFDSSMLNVSSQEHLRSCMTVDLLVLEFLNDFINKKIPSLLFQIIYKRFNKKLPVLYNSIYDKAQISMLYGAQVFNLLISTGIKQFKITR